MAVCSVGGSNSEDQSPLLKQGAIRGRKRVPCVIDARRFGSSPIQLDNTEVPTLFEIFLALVTNVIAANKKAGQLLRNLIDCPLQRGRMQTHSIQKNAALRVITGFNQFQNLARRQNLIST